MSFFLWGHEASATPSLQIFTTPLLRSSPEFDLQRGLPRRGLFGEKKNTDERRVKKYPFVLVRGRGATARGLAGGESTLDFFVSFVICGHGMSGPPSPQICTTSFHMQAHSSMLKGGPPRGAFSEKRKTPMSVGSKNTHAWRFDGRPASAWCRGGGPTLDHD